MGVLDDYTWDGWLPRKKTFFEKHKKAILAFAAVMGISVAQATDMFMRGQAGSDTVDVDLD